MIRFEDRFGPSSWTSTTLSRLLDRDYPSSTCIESVRGGSGHGPRRGLAWLIVQSRLLIWGLICASSTLISTATINGVDEGLAQGDGLRRFFDFGRLNVLADFDQGFTFLVSITAP